MKRWYAAHCKPRQDERAEENLLNQGYEVFRPRVRIRKNGKTVVESMFPRYLFIRLDDQGQEDWSPIRSTRGISDLVRWGSHVPHVPDSIIEGLYDRLDAAGCIELCKDFQPNQRVRITEGPFAGYEALFHARNGEERVIVLLNVMQQAQKLSVPATAVVEA